jgi:ubiquinone/menaquinone biosynthesis C-methylase UbiE
VRKTIVSSIATSYDHRYDTPGGQVHDRHQKALVQKFFFASRLGKTLLDAGYGAGHWSGFFASVGFEVTGVDISEKRSHRCKQDDHYGAR